MESRICDPIAPPPLAGVALLLRLLVFSPSCCFAPPGVVGGGGGTVALGTTVGKQSDAIISLPNRTVGGVSRMDLISSRRHRTAATAQHVGAVAHPSLRLTSPKWSSEQRAQKVAAALALALARQQQDDADGIAANPRGSVASTQSNDDGDDDDDIMASLSDGRHPSGGGVRRDSTLDELHSQRIRKSIAARELKLQVRVARCVFYPPARRVMP